MTITFAKNQNFCFCLLKNGYNLKYLKFITAYIEKITVEYVNVLDNNFAEEEEKKLVVNLE